MKFLDLNGLKHLLGKIVKYDSGTSNVSSIHNLKVNRIKTTHIQNRDTQASASTFIIFPDSTTIGFKAGDIRIEMNPTDGLILAADPVLESICPEEVATLQQQGLYQTLADILYTLKEKGIME